MLPLLPRNSQSRNHIPPAPSFYQRLDPHQPLPVEHLRKDGIGVNSADYVHRAPNIHFSGVLESSDDGSI